MIGSFKERLSRKLMLPKLRRHLKLVGILVMICWHVLKTKHANITYETKVKNKENNTRETMMIHKIIGSDGLYNEMVIENDEHDIKNILRSRQADVCCSGLIFLIASKYFCQVLGFCNFWVSKTLNIRQIFNILSGVRSIYTTPSPTKTARFRICFPVCHPSTKITHKNNRVQ